MYCTYSFQSLFGIPPSMPERYTGELYVRFAIGESKLIDRSIQTAVFYPRLAQILLRVKTVRSENAGLSKNPI